ncbi:endolytic transglycosylase MltG [Clostridium thermarum]|uniref:endolytic transglycosylase MltG n=1 Tax=Clostridium thermarum TaxID=1716543 RepID=UPI0013CFFA22|nr:endolytic transglycosylase MltG [Clostridium thermarum]
MKKKIFFILVPFLILILGISAFVYLFNARYGKTINSGEEYFIIKSDLSFDKGVEQLAKRSIIRSEKAIDIYARFLKLKSNFKAGNYIIKGKSTIEDLLLKLQSGISDFKIITIPEGYSLYKIGETLEKNDIISKNELLNASLSDINPTDLILEQPDVIYDLEGYLFPDTYYIPIDADKNKIISIMYENFLRVFSEEYRERAKELGLTVNQVITVASLIEKEAANDSERAKIAGVIYNRLKINMPLQIDAAVIYANTFGERSLNPITKAHLKVDSKYNTYVYKDLPPGPIASPGKPSIHAALYPETHDYLYYVAGPDGHVFSKTYEEHLKNINKYLK